jgi:type 1 fimbria pilin
MLSTRAAHNLQPIYIVLKPCSLHCKPDATFALFFHATSDPSPLKMSRSTMTGASMNVGNQMSDRASTRVRVYAAHYSAKHY